MAELTQKEFDDLMEQRFAFIHWREPIGISTPHHSGLGCRLCMARFGFKASEARHKLFASQDEFDLHRSKVHGTQQHGS